MKKRIYIFVTLFFISISFMNNSKASAELFGSDDEKWKRIFHGAFNQKHQNVT